VKHRPYMSSAERDAVIENHEIKAQEQDPFHMNMKERLEIAVKQHKQQQDRRNRGRKRLQKRQSMSLDEMRSARDYFWDYNTVEAVLLSCSVLVCLAGVMFESDRF